MQRVCRSAASSKRTSFLVSSAGPLAVVALAVSGPLAACGGTTAAGQKPDAAVTSDAAVVDAQVEAAVPNVTHTPSPCAVDGGLPVTVCADFDEDNIEEGFDGVNAETDMEIDVDDSEALCASPPGCAAAWVLESTATGRAEVAKSVAERPSALTARFELLDRCSALVPGVRMEIARFDITGDYELVLAIANGDLELDERAGSDRTLPVTAHIVVPSYAASSTSDWQNISLQTTFASSSQSSATVSTPTGNATFALAPSAAVFDSMAPVELNLGLTATPAVVHCTMYYDNVVMNVVPQVDAGAPAPLDASAGD